MFLNYLRISFRSLLKRRLFTLVNLLGLVLGLVSFLVIFAFVATEWSFNDFHTRKDDLYRILVSEGQEDYEYYLPPGYASIVEGNFDQVESVNRFVEGLGRGLMAVPGTDLAFNEEHINFVDGDFFQVMSFPIVRGKADLNTAKSAVITDEIAKKLYGGEDPIGKIFTLSNQFTKTEFTVTGVIEEIPLRSDIRGNVFLSINTLENPAYRQGNDWADPNGLTSGFVNLILLTRPGESSADLEEQLTAFIQQNPGAEKTQIHLQPLMDIHMGSSLSDPMPTFAEMGNILVFLAIAVLILGIAYLNYLNLSSASILTRIKEVRMRRVLGAQSWQLAQQFMTETLVLLVLATMISVLILVGVSPYLDNIFGTPIWLGALVQPLTLLIVMGVLLTCSLFSGVYVVLLSGRFERKSALKFQPDRQWLRKSLVVVQFVISAGIIICTLVIRDQLSFMQNQTLGMNVAQRVAISGPGDAGEDRASKMSAFKESLRSRSYIKGLAGSNNLPGMGYNFSSGGITPMVPRPQDEELNYSMLIVDEQYFPVYEIELLAGRNFTAAETATGWTTSHKVILNERAAKQLGFEPAAAAAGQTILWGEPFEVVGVVKDYHHLSLREEIKPSIFLPSQADGFFTLIIEPTQLKERLAEIQALYQQIFPGNPFNYSFTDEVFAQQYAREDQLSFAFSLAGILAILISCLGLFALAAYSVQQRTKEIGIRKVLGASSQSLVRLIGADFLILVLIGIGISIPISWYLMDNWQADFPYRSGLSVLTFVLAGLVSLVVAMVTVGLQAVRAALANPVEAIRSE